MNNILVIGIPLFLIIIFIFWKLTSGPMKKEYGEKMYKNWGSQLYYWQAAMYISVGITFVIMFFLKWANIVTI